MCSWASGITHIHQLQNYQHKALIMSLCLYTHLHGTVPVLYFHQTRVDLFTSLYLMFFWLRQLIFSCTWVTTTDNMNWSHTSIYFHYSGDQMKTNEMGDARDTLNGHERSVVMNALAGFIWLWIWGQWQSLVNMMAKSGHHKWQFQ